MLTVPPPIGTGPTGRSVRLLDMGGGRGGPRQPRNPAAVSNPQSGRRTDGGAGSKSQPLRVPTGGAYGQNKAATQQQGAAPMASGGPTAPGQPTAQGPSPDAAMGGGVFGPTERPNEPLAAPSGMENPMANDPQATLRLLYSVMPHPNIRRLLDMRPGDIR